MINKILSDMQTENGKAQMPREMIIGKHGVNLYSKDEIRLKIVRIKKKMKHFKKTKIVQKNKFLLNFIDELQNKKSFSENKQVCKNRHKKRTRKNYRNKKGKKIMKNLLVPTTPHNTSQYLITNFCQGRNEKVVNLFFGTRNCLEDELCLEEEDELLTIDDLCITGGSMKSIINSQYIAKFSSSRKYSEDSTNFSEVSNEDQEFIFLPETIPIQHIETASQSSTTNPNNLLISFFNLPKDDFTNTISTNIEIEQYKDKINKHELIIQRLQQQIMNKNQKK